MEEYLQDLENLSVQDLPRSNSSMSVRTDASGLGVGTVYNCVHILIILETDFMIFLK